MKISWTDGLENYKKYSYTIDPESKIHYFNTELLDAPHINYDSITEYCDDLFSSKKTKFIDVLYSGGLDSELVLHLCLLRKIPVRAITMRLVIQGYPINTHDLYYSEKFCRDNGITQVLIDLDVEKFFNNGTHINYLENYLITEPHVATHFWLLERCDGFPVFGGEYTWPWAHAPLLSPHRHHYCCYDKFLKENNISGIGNFMNHSLSANIFFIKKHLDIMKLNSLETTPKFIPMFKRELWRNLNLPVPNLRLRSYGWEFVPPSIFDIQMYRTDLLSRFGTTHSSITWGKTISNLIGGATNTNDKYR
jgi:hypothetical protein